MNESGLLLCFAILSLLALPLILYPLRKTKVMILLLVPALVLALSLTYWRWGAWTALQDHLYQEAKQQKVQALLQTIKSPSELILRLKARIVENPQSARGWYLLGRLHASQGEWLLARDAFFKAHQLKLDDEEAAVNYAQSLWQLNQQQFNQEIRDLFKSLVEKKPNQPDALAMLAMDAYQSHDYQSAIDYWQQLLKLAPKQSEEAQMISKAIAKAQQNLAGS